jgi:hypothetical protein
LGDTIRRLEEITGELEKKTRHLEHLQHVICDRDRSMIDVLLSILKRHGSDYDTVLLVSQAADMVGVCEDHKHKDIQDVNGKFMHSEQA